MATPTPRFDHFSEPVALLMESLTSIPGLALLRQSGLPIAAARQEVTTWYDGASGAGVMAKLLFDELKAKEEQGEMKVGVGERKVYILLGDSDQNMVNLAQQKLERKGWKDVEVKVFDAEHCPLSDSSTDFATLNFGLQLVPDYAKAIAESVRILKPRGTFGYTAWTSIPFFNVLSLADQSFVAPPMTDHPPYKPSTAATYLSETFKLVDVEVSECTAAKRFENATQCVEMFKKVVAVFFSDEARNERVRQTLVEEYGEGEFELKWEAIVVTAKKA